MDTHIPLTQKKKYTQMHLLTKAFTCNISININIFYAFFSIFFIFMILLARAERTEALVRHLMSSSWHQGPLKDSSGLWNQPAVQGVQRFNKFQGSSQGTVTLWEATQNLKPSKYLRMVIIDSLNLSGTIYILLMNTLWWSARLRYS